MPLENMINYVVKHDRFGFGRICGLPEPRSVKVEFFSPRKTLVLTTGLTRAFLPLESVCDAPNGRCRIKRHISELAERDPRKYLVEFEDGLTATLPETALVLVELEQALSPLKALEILDLEGYSTFRKRDALVEAWWQVLRGGLGVKALLSSRIDLKPLEQCCLTENSGIYLPTKLDWGRPSKQES